MPSSLQIFDTDGDLTLIFSVAESTDLRGEDQLWGAGSAFDQETESGAEEMDIETAAANPTTYSEVRFQVSSKHLMLASTVFKAMLKSSFAEGEALRTYGKADISLPDDDPPAFSIVMDIIHGRGRRVPRVVSLKLLVEMAVVVDKYQFYDAVDVFSDPWMAALQDSIPTCSQVELFYWLCISWVFRRATIFQAVTEKVLIGLSNWDCEQALAMIGLERDLPFPMKALDHIAEKRRSCFRHAYSVLDFHITHYTTRNGRHRGTRGLFRRGPYVKDDDLCDALILGTLLRDLKSKLTMWPLLDSLYVTMSWETLLGEIASIRITTSCTSQIHERDGHGVLAEILKDIKKANTSGLDLEDWI